MLKLNDTANRKWQVEEKYLTLCLVFLEFDSQSYLDFRCQIPGHLAFFLAILSDFSLFLLNVKFDIIKMDMVTLRTYIALSFVFGI